MFFIEATNHSLAVKELCCDRGGEFDSSEVQQILAESSTELNLRIPHMLEQNEKIGQPLTLLALCSLHVYYLDN